MSKPVRPYTFVRGKLNTRNYQATPSRKVFYACDENPYCYAEPAYSWQMLTVCYILASFAYDFHWHKAGLQKASF